MRMRDGRQTGGPFSGRERRLLELLCAGDGPSRAIARRQLALAHWGGYGFEDCECFEIRVPPPPRTEAIDHDGGPFAVLEVRRDGECEGHLNLWVLDGLLHSVDYMPFVDDHVHLPDPDEVCPIPEL